MGVNEIRQNIQHTHSNLSLEIFKEIFENLNRDLTIESIEEAQGSGRGDNYTATLYRIHVHGSLKEKGKKSKWETSVICKRLPDNIARREAYNSVQLFRNEISFYTEVMPELVNYQKSKGCDPFSAIPNYYLAKSDLLIMEDLRSRGFKMADRKVGLTLEECTFALKQIAIFHSLSLSYKFENPEKFNKLKSKVNEQIFCKKNESWYKDYYKLLTNNALSMVSDILPQSSIYMKKFNEFVDSTTFFNNMIKLVSEETEFSVICHGDCWTNNFLYRFDETGKVIEMSIVDFQLIRYGSAVIDVAEILYCCIDKSMRDVHLDKLLKIYSGELFKSFQCLGTVPNIFKTEEICFDLLKLELKKLGKFALGIALDIIPISTCSPEDAPDLYMEKTNDELAAAPTLNFPPNEMCKKKLSEIVIDLVDSEML